MCEIDKLFQCYSNNNTYLIVIISLSSFILYNKNVKFTCVFTSEIVRLIGCPMYILVYNILSVVIKYFVSE